MAEEECPLCFEPLSNGPSTKFSHPINGVCDGFNIHVTCRVNYVHSHITEGTNLFCTRCNLDMDPPGPVSVLDDLIETPLAQGILTFIGTVATFNIVVTGGDIRDYLLFGVCTVYVCRRFAPFLVRRNVGGTRKNRKRRKRGGTKHLRNYVLKPNEVAVITIRNPTEDVIRKVESMTGNPRKIISP
jgi:hypothetical protein